jgi:hypothetical protein
VVNPDAVSLDGLSTMEALERIAERGIIPSSWPEALLPVITFFSRGLSLIDHGESHATPEFSDVYHRDFLRFGVVGKRMVREG